MLSVKVAGERMRVMGSLNWEALPGALEGLGQGETSPDRVMSDKSLGFRALLLDCSTHQ